MWKVVPQDVGPDGGTNTALRVTFHASGFRIWIHGEESSAVLQ